MKPRAVANSQRNRAQRQAYVRANLRLITILLAIWASVSFALGTLLVKPLDLIIIGEHSLGGWLSQQGSIYAFVLLVFVYAWRMDRLDKKYRVRE